METLIILVLAAIPSLPICYFLLYVKKMGV